MSDPRLWSHGRFFSYALVFSGLFFLAHLAGLQADTSVLAGTHSGGYVDQSLGALYLILYVTFVCVVPILVIAGSLLWLGGRWMFAAVDETKAASSTPGS